MCFTVHVIFLNFYKHSPELNCDTCLAPEGFRRLICGPWPKKVVHHWPMCMRVSDQNIYGHPVLLRRMAPAPISLYSNCHGIHSLSLPDCFFSCYRPFISIQNE